MATILIVDDDDDLREVLVDSLMSMHHRVLEAGGAAQALTLLNRAPVDLLITDIRMPGVSGVELAERARSVRPQLRVLFISGHFVPADMAEHILRKPFDLNELAAAVGSELAG